LLGGFFVLAVLQVGPHFKTPQEPSDAVEYTSLIVSDDEDPRTIDPDVVALRLFCIKVVQFYLCEALQRF